MSLELKKLENLETKQETERWVPDSVFFRVSIFDGETKGTNLFSVREFGNDCLLYSLDGLLRYGDVLNLIQTDESDRVVERKEVPLFVTFSYVGVFLTELSDILPFKNVK